MARAKGMLNLSGNIEVLAGAPFDARELVPTKADLTVTSNFPYAYVGMETYVTAENKKYRYMGGDITDLDSWEEVGSGGGGGTSDYTELTNKPQIGGVTLTGNKSLADLGIEPFDGATSGTAGSAGLVPAPSAGDEGKVLFGNGLWGGIDLSNQSIESMIYSLDEKPVGMWYNRKIVYQKVFIPNQGSITKQTWTNLGTVGIGNNVVDTLIKCVGLIYAASGTEAFYIPTSSISLDYVASDDHLSIYADGNWNTRPVFIIFQYTKTTDSPLASDEKFAGVTSGGEVIYEQNVTVNNFSCSQGAETQIADLSSASIDKMIYCFGTISESSWGSASIPELGIRLRYKDGKLYLKSDGSWSSATVSVTIRYTKTS